MPVEAACFRFVPIVSRGKGPPAESYSQDDYAAFVLELTANTWQPSSAVSDVRFCGATITEN